MYDGLPLFRPIKPRDAESPKECVAELIAEAGGVKAVMVKLDVGKSQAYAWTDPQSSEQISFARVAALTSAGASAAAKYLARLAGGVFCALPSPRLGASPYAMTADAARSHGEAIAAIVDALRDGRITDAEATAGLKEVEEAICDLAALRGFLMAARR